MLISGIWAYALIEALLLVSFGALYLYWANRRLKRAATPGGARVQANAPGSVDHYVALLQEQILEADEKLAQLADQSGETPIREIVAMRLAFLRAERQAIDAGGNDREKFWSGISEAPGPFLPAANAAAASAGDDEGYLITMLQMRIQTYETRLQNLEQFRTNFLELKQKYLDAVAVGQQLHAEVGKVFSDDEQPPELRAAMQKQEQENTRLQGQFSQVEEEFDNIMHNLRSAVDHSDVPLAEGDITTSMGNVGRSMAQIREVIKTQEHSIQELTVTIAKLELELADRQRLSPMVDELRNRNTELTGIVENLQEENDFLQEQISMLLKQELEAQNHLDGRVKLLEQKLEEQSAAYAELDRKYSAMESEYMAAYEENKRLKG